MVLIIFSVKERRRPGKGFSSSAYRHDDDESVNLRVARGEIKEQKGGGRWVLFGVVFNLWKEASCFIIIHISVDGGGGVSRYIFMLPLGEWHTTVHHLFFLVIRSIQNSFGQSEGNKLRNLSAMKSPAKARAWIVLSFLVALWEIPSPLYNSQGIHPLRLCFCKFIYYCFTITSIDKRLWLLFAGKSLKIKLSARIHSSARLLWFGWNLYSFWWYFSYKYSSRGM